MVSYDETFVLSSVDNLSRAYLATYIPGSTDYINAVFVDVSITSHSDSMNELCNLLLLTINT